MEGMGRVSTTEPSTGFPQVYSLGVSGLYTWLTPQPTFGFGHGKLGKCRARSVHEEG